MAAHTIVCPDVHGLHRIQLPVLQFLMQQLVIIVIRIILEINLGVAVAVDAPAHRQITLLAGNIHFLNGAVAFLAVDFGHIHMLGVTEKHEIGQVVQTNPLNGLVILGGIDNFRDFKFSGMCSFPNQKVAIHAKIHCRNSG